MDTRRNDPGDDGLNYELPSSFAICWGKDEVAQFPTLQKALAYGEMEMDSFYVVRVQTGEVVASKCLREK